jgi:hypothetical protein
MTDPEDPTISRRESLRQALSKLAKTPASPSLTDELFALLPDIEVAAEAGASLEEIRSALLSQGLVASPGAFRGALYRARKRRKKGQLPPAAENPIKPKDIPSVKAARDAWASSVIPDEEPPRLLQRLNKKRDQET